MKTLVSLSLFLLGSGCSTIPRQDPTGKLFPNVRGEALDGKQWRLPDDLRGKPVLLLVGYKQNSQFDIDRWLLGIEQLGLAVKAIEVPTIAGMFPRMFSGRIDNGMRSGIPKPLWGGVVTVYADAGKIQRLTGTENGNNSRALLLDAEGRVVYFHDAGYSVPALKRLQQALAAQHGSPKRLLGSLTRCQSGAVPGDRPDHPDQLRCRGGS